jgi:hypothetical protein
MKFVLNVVMLVLLLTIQTAFAKDPAQKPQYTFKSQTEVLSEKTFPEIKILIKNYNFEPTEECSQKLAADIVDVIHSYMEDKLLAPATPARVRVLKYENEKNVGYVVEVQIVLHDQEESNEKIITSMLFGKRFLISVKSRSEAEI